MNMNVNYYIDFIKRKKLSNINKANLDEYRSSGIEIVIEKDVLVRLIYIIDGVVPINLDKLPNRIIITKDYAEELLEYMSLDKSNLLGVQSDSDKGKEVRYNLIINELVSEFIKYIEEDSKFKDYNYYRIV